MYISQFGVCALLDGDHQADILHGEHGLDHRDIDEVSDLLAAVLLSDGAGDQTLFDVVADHGAGHLHRHDRGEDIVDILGDLLKVEAYVWNFVIQGESEGLDQCGNQRDNLRIHGNSSLLCSSMFSLYYIGILGKSQPNWEIGFQKTLDRVSGVFYNERRRHIILTHVHFEGEYI